MITEKNFPVLKANSSLMFQPFDHHDLDWRVGGTKGSPHFGKRCVQWPLPREAEGFVVVPQGQCQIYNPRKIDLRVVFSFSHYI